MDLYQSPESCLEAAVEAAGGNKEVGHRLRPELPPVEAGKWLARCLSEHHAQRLNYAQERLVYRLARERGEHEGFRAYAESVGYRIEPLNVQSEIRALTERAESQARQANELLARAKAMHLNTEGMEA